MANVNYTNMNELLKLNYAGPMVEAINNEADIFNDLEDRTEQVTFKGKDGMEWRVHYGRSGGARAGSSAGVLPTPGVQKIATASCSIGVAYARVRFELMFLEQAKGNDAAFAQEMTFSMEALKNDMVADLSRQAVGGSGIRGVISELTAACDGTFTTAAPGSCYVKDATFFDIGDKVEIVTTGWVTRHTAGTLGMEVIDVDLENNLIYLAKHPDETTSTTAATAVGDYVVRAGSYTSGVGTLEMAGIYTLIDDAAGSVFGLNPATVGYGWWKSKVIHNHGGLVMPTATMLDKLITDIANKTGKEVGGPSYFLVSDGVQRSINKEQARLRRFVGTGSVLPQGEKVPLWEGPKGPVPYKSNRYAKKNTLLAPVLGELGRVKMGDGIKWMDVGSGPVQPVANYAMSEATLIAYMSILQFRRDCHGRIDNLQEADA